MAFRRAMSVMLILFPFVCGCGRTAADRAEIERARLEADKAKAEIAVLKAEVAKLSEATQTRAYLDELEKLSSLMQKNVITQEEFDRRKQAILDGQKLPVVPKPSLALSMEELAKQLRTLQSLYNTSTITGAERDAKKAQLLQQPLQTSDLAKDLETVKSLYSTSVITSSDHQTIKQKLLGLADKDDHGHDH